MDRSSTSDFRLAIATCSTQPDLIDSERYLIKSLSENGVEALPVVWNDPTIVWSKFDGILVRTIWDYHQQHNRFLEWIDMLADLGIIVGNPKELLKWNSHKFYLHELAQKDISIPLTLFLSRGASAHELKTEWSDFIIKPAVSATAYQTFKLTPELLAQKKHEIASLLQQKDMLLQEYIPTISTAGEWSLVYFNKLYSHAVIKKASKGEYRVQAEFGGSYTQDIPDKSVIDFANSVLAQLELNCLYARVDIVVHEGSPMLMELELIEPELFLMTEDIKRRFSASICYYFGIK